MSQNEKLTTLIGVAGGVFVALYTIILSSHVLFNNYYFSTMCENIGLPYIYNYIFLLFFGLILGTLGVLFSAKWLHSIGQAWSFGLKYVSLTAFSMFAVFSIVFLYTSFYHSDVRTFLDVIVVFIFSLMFNVVICVIYNVLVYIGYMLSSLVLIGLKGHNMYN